MRPWKFLGHLSEIIYICVLTKTSHCQSNNLLPVDYNKGRFFNFIQNINFSI